MVVYVDDLVVICEEDEYEEIIQTLNMHFERTSLGDIPYFLGIEGTIQGILLKQKSYIIVQL